MTKKAERGNEPCAHISSWRRIRAKKGYNHFTCEYCGSRWRIMTMKKRYQLYSEKDKQS
jgi:DNA-directed RNA polymerase subunit RPC12/RpoP